MSNAETGTEPTAHWAFESRSVQAGQTPDITTAWVLPSATDSQIFASF